VRPIFALADFKSQTVVLLNLHIILLETDLAFLCDLIPQLLPMVQPVQKTSIVHAVGTIAGREQSAAAYLSFQTDAAVFGSLFLAVFVRD